MKEEYKKLVYLEDIDRKTKRKTDRHGNEQIETKTVLTFKSSDKSIVLKMVFEDDLEAKKFMEGIELPVSVGVPVMLKLSRGMGKVGGE